MSGLTREEIRSAVKEAVAEALKAANLIDGPTHIAHHQALEDMILARRHAHRVGITVIVGGLVGLLIMGIRSWLEK
ncbi:MAG: hypothetical protein LBP61_02125 [Desulfovibrio sp.]|jgi:hypothetical protein|nr:hypothetical protein [Desulfovibrio sp.]